MNKDLTKVKAEKFLVVILGTMNTIWMFLNYYLGSGRGLL